MTKSLILFIIRKTVSSDHCEEKPNLDGFIEINGYLETAEMGNKTSSHGKVLKRQDTLPNYQAPTLPVDNYGKLIYYRQCTYICTGYDYTTHDLINDGLTVMRYNMYSVTYITCLQQFSHRCAEKKLQVSKPNLIPCKA